MEMVNVLHSSVCSSAYFSCPLWRLRLKIIGVGSNWNVYYYSNNIPSKGTNITLNLDNPVSTTITPSVSGKWTPN